jgi:two-component system NtrC family response regulator
VEDDPNLRQIMEVQVAKEGYAVSAAADAETALELCQKNVYEVILADLHLPGMSGLDLLKRIRTEAPKTSVILMTAFGTVPTAVEAMKSGAYDYITKPVHPYELKLIIRRAIERNELVEEVQTLRSTLDQKYGFEHIVGSSWRLLYALDLAARIAPTDVTVLIQGETGTGKELVAKAIHQLSTRRERPFVVISCGAIPKELLESELFGHVRGAFTGAMTNKPGKAELAHGGTLLLDEIGEMPLDLQIRVMRLIQEHEIEKVGARGSTKIDVRILAATHRDLAAMVKEGTFREDLYYRLLVVPIKVPALREREKDIEELAQFFFSKFKTKHNRADLRIRPDVLPCLLNYPWPGNVRQLENAVERIVLLTAGSEVRPQDLPDFLSAEEPETKELPIGLPEGLSVSKVEKQLILQTLERTGGNRTKAALLLGMSRRVLAYKLVKYGVQPMRRKPSEQGRFASSGAA